MAEIVSRIRLCCLPFCKMCEVERINYVIGFDLNGLLIS